MWCHTTTWTGNNGIERCLSGDPIRSLQQHGGGGGSNGGSRFSVTLLAVTSITTWPSSWTLSVTAAAVTSSIMHSAGVTITIWRRGGITTEGVIHLDSPDEQPSVLADTASWTHRWFGARHSLLLAGSYVYGAPCEQSHIRTPLFPVVEGAGIRWPAAA